MSMLLSKWKTMHKKCGHRLDVIEAEMLGTHWYFTPREPSALRGLWAQAGAVVSQLRIVPYDQLTVSTPIEMLYGRGEALPFNAIPLFGLRDRLEVIFAEPLQQLWISTKVVET